MTGREMPTLLPCPFCLSTMLTIARNSFEGDAVRFVVCRDCGAQGRTCIEEVPAVEAWNTRPTPQPAAIAEARREVWETAARIAENGCLVPPDGGDPTEAEVALCDEIAARIRSFAASDPVGKPAPLLQRIEAIAKEKDVPIAVRFRLFDAAGLLRERTIRAAATAAQKEGGRDE